MQKQIRLLLAFILFGFLAMPIAATASVKSYSKDNSGVTFILDTGLMRINVYQPGII